MLNYAQECRDLGIPFAFDPSQQTARLSGEDFAVAVPQAAYLLCNEYELAMIQNKTGWSLEEILGKVGVLVLTLGKRGSLIYSGAELWEIPPATLLSMEDPTGAGDAWRGGFFAALRVGLPLPICGRVGSLCSAYALENTGTTAHRFTPTEFVERYRQTYGPELALDVLLAEHPAPVRLAQEATS
jgi:adenosine kinase